MAKMGAWLGGVCTTIWSCFSKNYSVKNGSDHKKSKSIEPLMSVTII